VLEASGADKAEAVLLADGVKNYSGIHILFEQIQIQRQRKK
jgi:hypothetical protein